MVEAQPAGEGGGEDDAGERADARGDGPRGCVFRGGIDAGRKVVSHASKV